MTQKDIFLNGESDNWFFRNKESLKNQTEFIDVNEVLGYIKKQSNILEIGCSNGTKLNYIQEKLPNLNLSLFGIDPSVKSIKDGKSSFCNLKLEVGTSDLLNYPDNFFDIVLVGFCLYLVDRNLIFKTISEIDRVLKQNGFLVITDFEPPFPIKKPYIHKKGVYSFKNNYSNFFVGGGHYNLLRKVHYNHKDLIFDSNFNERVSTSILYKENLDEVYRELR
jgi:ubiquinone/menaquinone biosynthesis C-methylase UbiE